MSYRKSVDVVRQPEKRLETSVSLFRRGSRRVRSHGKTAAGGRPVLP